jgi:hypothetical protein
VKKRLTIALAAVVFVAAAATSLAVAASYQRARAQATQVTQATPADALLAYEILNSVRALGFKPTTQALRRGPYYVLHAIDRRGIEMRVVADAQLGDIVSVAPVLAPRFNGGPRIIHVPQPGERDDRASTRYENGDNSAPGDSDDADADQLPPPPRRSPARRPYQRMEAPPARASVEPPPRAKPEPKPEPKPLGPPRAVLSAPPPPAGTALTPIYPTPKFDARSEPAERFSEPEKIAPPPSGYTPPAVPRGRY